MERWAKENNKKKEATMPTKKPAPTSGTIQPFAIIEAKPNERASLGASAAGFTNMGLVSQLNKGRDEPLNPPAPPQSIESGPSSQPSSSPSTLNKKVLTLNSVYPPVIITDNNIMRLTIVTVLLI